MSARTKLAAKKAKEAAEQKAKAVELEQSAAAVKAARASAKQNFRDLLFAEEEGEDDVR